MLSRQEKAKIFMERFFGRRDVYGRRWESARPDGTTHSGYAPVCTNLWSPGCGLRNKTSNCDGCQAKQYEPVSETSVLRHIDGIESQIQYVLQPDGSVFFAALDFDRKQKPGKEHLDYSWEDVTAVASLLREWGVPYGIARSTGHGWHVYFFFDGPYQASRCRAVMVEIFERVGFMEQMRLCVRPLCESFPKQSYVSPDGIGNGIKCPGIETSWANERNCFVDDNNVFIPDQWGYLNSIPRIPPAMFDDLITRFEIPVYEDTVPRGTTSCGAPTNGERKISGTWRQPLTGSFEKVMHSCPAFRKVRDKALKGDVLGHGEGFALYRLAMSTADGLSWFQKNVQGWGTDAGQIKQLEHSLKKNYAPDSCAKLQEMGICVPGTKCLKRKPPVDQVEGQRVVRSDLPESQWPSPGPVRFAYMAGDDFLEQLKEETMRLKDEKDPAALTAALEAMFARVQVFDDDQQKEYKAFVRALKLVKPGEFSKLFAKASDAAEEEVKKNVADNGGIIETHGNRYSRIAPYGYNITRVAKGRRKDTAICLCDIDVEEERTYIDDGRVVQTVFAGTCRGAGVEKKFEIGHDKWMENADFAKFFLASLGNTFNIQKLNVDAIRQAALAFSQRRGITKSSHLITQGWYGQTYLMPTVLVDKDGIRPNTEQTVSLHGKEHAKSLDFSILSDGEFVETMMGIKSHLLNAWPRFWMTFGLAHTLMPCVLRPIGMNQKRSTLFYEGLTGTGKTEITHILQQFWGDFNAPLNMISSQKGIMEEAYHFKDAILVVDDYKGINRQQTDALKSVIQYSYDGSSSAKQNRDCTQQKSKMARATLMMSGEHFLESESSAVARTILLEIDKFSAVKTRDSYTKSWAMAKSFKGITPRFIHWLLNQDLVAAKKLVETYHADLQSRSSGKQNASRIALNMSLNYLVWNLWVQFMADSNVIDRKESEALLEEHWGYILKIQDTMLGRCEDEQSGMVFMRFLRELIAAKEVSIEGLDGYHNPHKQVIARICPSDPNIANVLPDTTLMTVRIKAKDTGIAGNERSIGRQLADMGILCSTDPSRLKKLVRFGETRTRVWPIKLSELGFEIRPDMTVVNTVALEKDPGPQPDKQGIL